MKNIRNFWNDEQGQDLIEYTLLLAFVALASAALFIFAAKNMSSTSIATLSFSVATGNIVAEWKQG